MKPSTAAERRARDRVGSRDLARVVAALAALVAVAGAVAAAALTVFAYRYDARTGEDFPYGFAVLAWAAVLCVAVLAAVAWRWSRRRA